MYEWWDAMSSLNRAFYCSATFFSVFFIWQMLAALLGLAGDDADVDADTDLDAHGPDCSSHDFEQGADTDSSATLVAFKLLSIRAIITFCTLFSWGSALYLWGWQVAKLLAFPLFFFWLAIPLPGFQQATTGLQHLAAQLARRRYSGERRILEDCIVMLGKNQNAHAIAPITFNLSTSSSTVLTLTPAERFDGSVTLTIVRRGVGSTP